MKAALVKLAPWIVLGGAVLYVLGRRRGLAPTGAGSLPVTSPTTVPTDPQFAGNSNAPMVFTQAEVDAFGTNGGIDVQPASTGNSPIPYILSGEALADPTNSAIPPAVSDGPPSYPIY